MISVLLPVRNGARYLPAAIDSVLDQTYGDLELIVVDDGSTDESRAVAESARRTDPRVRVITTPPHGVSAALNVGLAEARGEWIARMDADDRAHRRRLERQRQAAEIGPAAVAWTTWAHVIDREGRVRGILPRGPRTQIEFERAHRSGHLEVNCATILVRRSDVLDVGGYDERFSIGEDIELYDRLGELGPILTIPAPLYQVRIHGASAFPQGVEEGLRVGRFVAARRAARRRGDDLTFEVFLAQEDAAGWPQRLLRRVRDRARALHETGTVRYFDRGKLAAAPPLLAAAALDPPSAFRRVRRRRRRSAGPAPS